MIVDTVGNTDVVYTESLSFRFQLSGHAANRDTLTKLVLGLGGLNTLSGPSLCRRSRGGCTRL